MSLRRKQHDPIDRAIDDLDQKIASLQRQLREAEVGPNPLSDHSPRTRSNPVQAISSFAKNFLRANDSGTAHRPGSHPQDLFDVTAEPLKDLEAEPIAFASKSEPDLFAGPPIGTSSADSSAALETAEVVPAHQKLAHYLGAGSIKSYKPLKHVQRQMRNRFFMWLGLSFAALWIIWFVIR